MRDEQTLGFFFDFKELIIRPMREDDLEVIVPLINEGFSYQEKAKENLEPPLQKCGKE